MSRHRPHWHAHDSLLRWSLEWAQPSYFALKKSRRVER